MKRTLCHLAEIPDGQGKGFVLEEDAQRREVFVVRRGARAFGYVNSCPHQGTPLDWTPDRFVTRDGRHILCATHGARFDTESGRCIAGPCPGTSLTAVPLTIEGAEQRIVLLED